MKKKISFIARYAIFFVLIAALFSCEKDYLDRTPSDFISEKEVFTNIQNAEAFLNNAYSFLPDFHRSTEDGGGRYKLGAGTDELGYQQSSFVTQTPYDFNNGNWSPESFPLQRLWFDYFSAVRRINVFLKNYDLIPDEVTSGGGSNRKQRLLGEAYGLRAYYYFELFKMWGGVPIITNPLEPGDRESVYLARNTPEEVVVFIQEDLSRAAALLPARYDDSQFGRFTQTVGRSLAARVALYFASSYWNGDNNLARWADAAARSEDALDYAERNGYMLSTVALAGKGAYERVFLELGNTEIIWAKNSGDSESLWWNYYGFPLGYGGWYVDAPLQEMVDAYEMTNGELPVLGYTSGAEQIVNPASGYDPQNPYVDRDPRFYQSILYHGAPFQGRPVNVAPGGADYVTIGAIVRVNYFTKKYLQESHNLFTGAGNTYRRFALFRLAELYLNYAEALNEAEGPVAEVYSAVNIIRNRSDMPELPAGLTKEQMRERIRRERRVELAFEDHRFWDVRRWKIAEVVDSGPVHKVEVDADGRFTYPVFQTRRFDPTKHYLFPIPQKEMDKNPNMSQNPGWN